MKYKLIASVSMSLLIARLRQTLVAAIGVTFSITMFIALLSFMAGLNELLDNLILNRTPHVRLYNEILPSKIQPIDLANSDSGSHNFIASVKPKNEPAEISNSVAIIRQLRSDPRVLGVAPKTAVPVFYNIGTISLTGMISGIEVEAESKLFTFDDYVVQGHAQDLNNTPNSIILGIGAAEKMLAKIGDVISVTNNVGQQFPLRVVGFFQSGIQDLDKVQSYTSITTSQKVMGRSVNFITDIQIKLKDREIAPQLALEYANLFDLDAIDIQTANSQFETGSFVRTLISYAVGVTLLIVAGFGIYNILNMMIYEKMDSIAILKATGFSGNDVNQIFITIALSIGIFGGLLGLMCGFGLTFLISQIPFTTASLPTVETYPVTYSPAFYIIGGVFSIATTYLAGFFPSRRASRIDPVVIIRGK